MKNMSCEKSFALSWVWKYCQDQSMRVAWWENKRKGKDVKEVKARLEVYFHFVRMLAVVAML